LQLDRLGAQLLDISRSCLWGKQRMVNHLSKFSRIH
jgi:hypothetical protein